LTDYFNKLKLMVIYLPRYRYHMESHKVDTYLFGSCIKSGKFKLLADNLQFYYIISSITDFSTIQNDLKNLMKWCESNKLSLNVSKCFKTSYYRTKNKIMIFDYEFNYKRNEYNINLFDFIHLFFIKEDSCLR